MESKWIIWTFVPSLTWAGWFHAGIRTKHTKYFIYAALYGIPFMLLVIFSSGNDMSSAPKSNAYDVVIHFQMVVWIGGIIHAQIVKKEVDLRIKYADLASVSSISSTDGELERKISAEYGVEALPPNMSRVGQMQTDAAPVGEDMSFEEWYTNKFDWFNAQPMPWKIVFEVVVWLAYGFIWIPLWYAISDKKRTTAQPDPAIQPLGEQPVQSPTFLQQSASPAVPPPSSPAPAVPPRFSTEPYDSSAVDVNNAAEQDISALPGIGPILAKKAIKIRQTEGGFESLEQFAQGLGLKPHVIGQLRSRVVIGPLPAKALGAIKKPVGRVVDF
jgi:hypothetical protein